MLLDDLFDLEAGLLVGFLEAEAHFCVAPANAGQSYSCSASLVARDDDAELIIALRDRTGIGCLSRRAAARNSHPQIVWTIATRPECAILAELLVARSPIGRKAAIGRCWCEAVELWCDKGPDRATQLRRVRMDLRATAAYCAEPRPARMIDPFDEFDRGYVTGLVIGDGHFQIAPPGARLAVHLRDDDRPLLRSLQVALGGSIYAHPRYRTSHPSATWVIRTARDLSRMRGFLAMDLFPSRKRREFDIWCHAVEEHLAADFAGRRRDRVLLGRLAVDIRDARAYAPPRVPIRVEPRRPARRTATRTRCLEALTEFATRHDGALDALTYMVRRREQHPEWPARNTVARHFGGWYQALEAAGLADRAARDPDRFANRSTAARDAARAVQRERVLASVRRFIREVGHVPRAMEYFRWRLARDPDSPTQATVYKLFAGGWSAVLAAL